MNKIIAIDPEAIESYPDWLKIHPFIGHEKGVFIANFPKNWVNQFKQRELDTKNWGFWDLEKIKEFFILQKMNNTFISLNSPYDSNIEWANNYLNIEETNKEDCVAFAQRQSKSGLKTLDDLDPRDLIIDTTINEKFTIFKLTEKLNVYLRNSSKIAIVDRHNYLTNSDGSNTKFVDFIKTVLVNIKGSKCHEILIYAKHDPIKHPYMESSELVKKQLLTSFNGFITPTYGIKYMCCKEYQNGEDLHSRKIVTNHAVFILSDSVVGKTYSQSITRVPDKHFREANLKSWIDEEHGLEVVSSGTFINFS
jgi:hypothetical protein